MIPAVFSETAPPETEYAESPPPAPLRALVRCLWRSAPSGPRRIVPDGCLDLVAGAGQVFVAGPDTGAWSSSTTPGAVLHGLRFRPGTAPGVLGVAADELRDTRVPLAELWGREGAVLAERVLEGRLSLAELVRGRPSEPDPAIMAMIEHLERGPSRVGALPAPPNERDPSPLATIPLPPGRRGPSPLDARQSPLGERQLRRRFTVAVGYGPATYLRISRFQRAIAAAPRTTGLAELAAVAGYADQAHLARDCRAFSGSPPGSYFS
ncbi:helix-turn-helix domain-containing protein [Amycolatopsis sp. PS_44_ISF1]|uniref:helix-turn-helix domain-containing protein n=1 Tax=Amycolatopsis sp. PS_44_ISF1 TaxID=2974917 RepID=UPI0028DEB634|nr:helix-turn-helix domain-containing protein [Amycolatopsis sp. PS_44_ISF1]MDT8915053.1 helix-turn-helix domain-containing protein [Amycolatopsis sp. PS_44_ISF1]